ncbi:MAG: magnesium transporter, partial [Dysgonomonas sp.]
MKDNLKLYVEQTESLIENKDSAKLQEFLDSLHISDIEDLIDELPEEAAQIIDTMSINRAISVFRILDVPTQERVLEKLPK